jgi:hypothetical protein
MPKYYFHLVGQISAHDLLGHPFDSDDDARGHGSFIAHQLGTEKRALIQNGNYILVTRENGAELAHIPLASTTA